MSMPVNFSLTDQQIEDLMEEYDTKSIGEVRENLRQEFDSLVEDKIE